MRRWWLILLGMMLSGRLAAQPYAGGRGDGWASVVWGQASGLQTPREERNVWRLSTSRDFIWITANAASARRDVRITLFSADGRRIWHREYLSPRRLIRIPWKDLPAGAYLLRIGASSGRVRYFRLNRMR